MAQDRSLPPLTALWAFHAAGLKGSSRPPRVRLRSRPRPSVIRSEHSNSGSASRCFCARFGTWSSPVTAAPLQHGKDPDA